jgi:methyl-accepting chemotaxis protein
VLIESLEVPTPPGIFQETEGITRTQWLSLVHDREYDMSTRQHSKTATIGFRIFIAFFCIFFLVILQGGLAFYNSRKVVESQQNAYTNQLTLLALREKLSHLRIRMFMLLGTLNPTKMETLKTEIETLFTDITEESQALNIQSEVLASSQETYQQIMALHWDFRTTQAYELINSTSEEEYETIYETLETLGHSIEATMQETIRQANRQFVSITIVLGVVGLLIVALWGWYLIRSIANPIKQAVRSAQMIADGDLSMSITVRRNDETGQLLVAFNAMTTRLKALLAEIETLIQAVQTGNLNLRGNAQAFAGSWRDLIQGMNTVIDAFVAPITMTARSLDRIAKGDIPDTITEDYQGDFNEIKTNLNTLIETMRGLLQETNGLIQAIQDGKLDTRGQADQFVGDWRELVVGVNNVIDAFVAPIMMAAVTIDLVARGDIPEKITQEYQGDFNEIRQNLNILITVMHEITRLAEEMAAGDLTLEVEERSEQDALMQALNTMIAKLNEVVVQVQSAADNVAVGSREMRARSEEMSQGANQQAAAAEEASSSMEEMVANIRQNADNARQTEKIALQSAQYAEESSRVVAETVFAMQQIAKKISIIQEISDQTRMLSLNATIEAARAQEHGKAFSVVASEVRKLSDMTKTAAEEINELASSSVGVAVNAGEMLAKLVPNIHKTAELVQEISAASNEQSSGAEQVNKAIQQLDQVTQYNSLLSENLSSASVELAAQAEQLWSSMRFFRIDETSRKALDDEKRAMEPVPSQPVSVSGTGEKRIPGGTIHDTREEAAELVLDTEMNEGGEDDHDADFERY